MVQNNSSGEKKKKAAPTKEWRRKWQATQVFLPGKPHGQPDGLQSMGSQEWDTTQRLNYHHQTKGTRPREAEVGSQPELVRKTFPAYCSVSSMFLPSANTQIIKTHQSANAVKTRTCSLSFIYFFLLTFLSALLSSEPNIYQAFSRLFVQRRQWHPTLVLLPGKSHGRRSLVGCSPWGR